MFQCKIPGIGFLKVHAPWNVLCREAEFMKLKMPTKKVNVTVCVSVRLSGRFNVNVKTDTGFFNDFCDIHCGIFHFNIQGEKSLAYFKKRW